MKEKLLSHSLKEEIKDKRGTNCFANLILMLESNIKTTEMWSSGKITALYVGGFSSIFGIIPYTEVRSLSLPGVNSRAISVTTISTLTPYPLRKPRLATQVHCLIATKCDTPPPEPQ